MQTQEIDLATSEEPVLKEAVVDRQLREFKRQIPPVNLSIAITTGFLVIGFIDRLPATIFFAYGIHILFAVMQALRWRAMDIRAMDDVRKSAELTQARQMAIGQSVACAVVSLILFDIGADQQRVMLAAWIASAAFGGAVSLSSDSRSSLAVIAICLAPAAMRMILSGDPLLAVLGIFMSLSGAAGALLLSRHEFLIWELCRERHDKLAAAARVNATLRSFIETASDWAWESDADGRLTYVSPQFAAFCGARVDEMVGYDIAAIHRKLGFERDNGERVNDELKRREAFRDVRFVMADDAGAPLHVSISAQPRRDHDGAFLGYVGWIKNITAEATAERKLRESEERFRDYAEIASDWVWETDAQCRYTYISDRASEVTGLDHKDYLGTLMGGVVDAISTARDDRSPFREVTFEMPLADRTLCISQSGKPVFDQDGTFLGFRGVGRDVTQKMEARRQAEEARFQLEQTNSQLEAIVRQRTEALQDRTALLDEVFETMAEGVLVLDDDLRIVARNTKTLKISKLPDGFWAVGASIVPAIEIGIKHGMYEARTVDQFVAGMRAGARSGKPWRVVRRQKDGTTIQEDARARAKGGVVVTYTDITDLSERQAQLERMSEDLRAAKDEAVAASRAKSDFLANMSHEIRTPMNGVVGMASLLLGSPLSSRQREMAEVIVRSGDNLLKIINDILDFSRVEAGKLKIVNEPFDLRAAIDDVTTLLGLHIQEKGLELMVRYQPSLGQHFIGDAGRLRQAVTNLLGNAVKFTDQGHIVIDVSGERRGEIADVEIAVTDTGCGIQSDRLAAVFEAFEQADNSAARRFDGAGLGLAITKGIIEQMGGAVGAESVPGKGSTFRLRLSLQTDEAALSPSTNVAFKGIRALIVDDNAVNRIILSEQLGGWGMTATAVASPHEALDLLREQAACGEPFQIAILDYQMPLLNGVALARAIRADAAIATAPLVLLTSAGRKGDPESDVRGLFDAYLVKPARASLLQDAIASALQNGSAMQAQATAIRLAAAEASEMCACGYTSDARPLDVLVAEDNIVNQMVVKSMLEKLGCSVRMTADGAEVVAAYDERAPDLVLMDVSMPGIDGVKATQMIRAKGAAGAVPIIGVTAHALREDRQKCLDAGMDDYLPKPVRLEALDRMLERWTIGEKTASAAGK